MDATRFEEILQGKPLLEKVGVALLGLGKIGMAHLQNLLASPLADLLYCLDSDVARLRTIREKVVSPSTQCLHASDFSRVLADPNVKAVIVCTPTFTHRDYVLSSIAAGKAVFCEKPLAETKEDVELCYQKAGEAGVALFCAFNRRFDPEFSEIRNRLRSKEIGEAKVVKTCSRGPQAVDFQYLKGSGGIFKDSSIHDIDFLCHLLGEFPVSVAVQAHSPPGPFQDIGEFESILITFKFPSGTLGLIDNTRHSPYGYDQKVEVLTTQALLIAGDCRPSSLVIHDGSGTSLPPIYQSFTARYKDSYVAEMDHFLSNIHDPHGLRVKGSEVVGVLRVIAACEESARTGTFVRLSWD